MVYVGDLLDGKRHGQGSYLFADGSLYAGEWIADKREGEGTHRFADGSIYKGEWLGNLRHGAGNYTTKAEHCCRGFWENDLRHGFFTIYRNDGSKMNECKWINGVHSGHTTFYASDGLSRYAGTWEIAFEAYNLNESKIALAKNRKRTRELHPSISNLNIVASTVKRAKVINASAIEQPIMATIVTENSAQIADDNRHTSRLLLLLQAQRLLSSTTK